jgi:DNA polymerase-3 subunit epsilon
MREIVFDTETTGLNHATGDRLVEIGCVELINRCETGRSYHAYFHPERDMPAEAERIHGLSLQFLSDKPRFHEAVDELIAFIGDAPLIAHNATFDFGFLNAELTACGRAIVDAMRMVDTLAMARARHPGAKHSLDALCTRYGIDRSHRIKHGALLDAQLLAQLYVELTGGRQIGLGLADSGTPTLPSFGADRHRPLVARPIRPPRPHAANSVERERHKLFVATLINSVWESVSQSVDA